MGVEAKIRSEDESSPWDGAAGAHCREHSEGTAQDANLHGALLLRGFKLEADTCCGVGGGMSVGTGVELSHRERVLASDQSR